MTGYPPESYIPPTFELQSDLWRTLNLSNRKLPNGKLSLIFVFEIIKTLMLPANCSARRSNLFLVEFMFKCANCKSCLSPSIDFRTLLQTTISSITFQTKTLHKSCKKIAKNSSLHPFESNEVYLYLDAVAFSSLNYQSNKNFFLYRFLKVLY